MKGFIHKFIRQDFYSILGYVFFLYFFVLSILFYKECIISQDNASELSFILSKQSINPVYFRWGVIPFRIFAIVGPYLNLSLQTILILTSFWFVLLKFVGWLICNNCFKNKFAGLLVIASVILSLDEGFYNQVLQMYYASLYFCILFAIIQDKENIVIKSDWISSALIIFFLILIHGTHIVVFMICPLLLFYDSYDHPTPYKIFYLAVIAVVSVLYLSIFKNPHESSYMAFMWRAFTTKGIMDITGIWMYLLKEILSLNFSFPLLAFIFLAIFQIKSKRYLLLVITTLYILGIVLLVLLRLASHMGSYPLSNDITFYAQAAFYSPLFITVALLFYEAKRTECLRSIIHNRAVKYIVIFITIFYTSKITVSGIEKVEYNRYLEVLLRHLEENYKERIFIVNPNWIPYRFSKLNINAEYETLIKSNIYINKSLSLYITPFTTPLSVNGESVFKNCIYQVDTSIVVREMNPYNYFKGLDTLYFKFDNYNYRILDRKYMANFNKRYGFPINEYEND